MAGTLVRTAGLGRPAIALHGGAGADPARLSAEARRRQAGEMRAALGKGWEVLAAGGSALDAAVETVAWMEDSGLFNAGRGAVPTTAGDVETDAGVMSGRLAGAVCAATWPANPVRAALVVARAEAALLLAGAGADAAAREAGLPRRDPATLTHAATGPVSKMGTVGAVALDASGTLAAATSTGGRRGQPPGRVGDSPVIGAGTWAAPGGVAVSATGDGEAFVKAGFAHLVDAAVRDGAVPADACRRALEAVEAWGGTGGAVVLDPAGGLVIVHDTPVMAWGWQGEAGSAAEVSVDAPGG